MFNLQTATEHLSWSESFSCRGEALYPETMISALLEIFNSSARSTFRFAAISDRFSVTPDGQGKHDQAINGQAQQFARHVKQSGSL